MLDKPNARYYIAINKIKKEEEMYRVIDRRTGNIFKGGFADLESAESYISALPARTRFDCYADPEPAAPDWSANFLSIGLTADGKIPAGFRVIYEGGRDEQGFCHLANPVVRNGMVYAEVIDYEGYGTEKRILGVFPAPLPTPEKPEPTYGTDQYGNVLDGEELE